MKVRNYSYWYILISILYAIGGMGLGLYQHLSKNFQYIPLHGHVSSLGWLSLAVIGLLYKNFPAMGASRLAPWQFWTAQAGVLGLNGGLVLVYLDSFRAPIYVGTVLTPLSFVLLLVIFARSGRETPNA